MSDDSKVVTIHVPVAVARRYAEADSPIGAQLRQQFADALDVRKSKYQRWREALGEFIGGAVGYSEAQMRLIHAAPQLLDALIETRRGGAWLTCAYDALEAALPEDVFREVIIRD